MITIERRVWADNSRFKRFAQRIKAEHAALESTSGTKIGFRFLYGPIATLNDPNGNVVLGINPGPEADLTNRLYVPQTAYYSEDWNDSEYQSHVRAFMQAAWSFAAIDNWRKAWDESLTANLIPFRSRGFAELQEARRCVKFGCELWRDIFAEIGPRAIIAFGGPPATAILELLHDSGWRPSLLQTYPAKQPKTKAELYSFDGPRGEGRALLAPHYARGHGVRRPDLLRAMAAAIAPFLRHS